MFQPAQPTMERPLAVRDGREAPVTCAACGCRLAAGPGGSWHHFAPAEGRDARGCLVRCAELPHDRHGRVIALG